MPEFVAGVRAARPGERIEVWFEDEARFGQKGTLTRVWAPRGSRPTAPKQTAYANVHVLAAVCPATGRAESLVSDGVNTEAVQVLLDQLAESIPEGTHAVLVWDGAGYHSASKALRVPANITPVTLPPYSPELNPVERLWLYLREHFWSNRVYKDLAALWAAALGALDRVAGDPERIRTVCRCGYANPATNK